MVIHKIGILSQVFPKTRKFAKPFFNSTCFTVIGSGAQRYYGVILTNSFDKTEVKNRFKNFYLFPPHSETHFLHQGPQQYIVFSTTATIQGQFEISILKLVMTFFFSGSSLFERYNITNSTSATLLSSRSNGFKNNVISNLPLFYRGRYYFFKMFPYSLGVNDPPPPTQLNSVS